MRLKRSITIALIGLGALSGTGKLALAQEISRTGTLTAIRACEARVTINKKNTPGSVFLVPGQVYPVTGRNKEDGAWIKLKVPGVGRSRWVEEHCGAVIWEEERRGRTAGSLRKRVSGGGECPARAKDLRSFFDTGTNVSGYNADPTPEDIVRDSFDLGVLALCGGWGTVLGGADLVVPPQAPASEAEKKALRDLFDAFPDVVDAVWRWSRSENFALSPERNGFSETLTDIWTRRNGFRHVFCGEPGPGMLGGLHFAPRYRQAGDNHWAGLATKSQACEECGVFGGRVHILSVCYATPYAGNAVVSERVKSYVLGASAQAILADATAAFYRLGAQGGGSVCATFQPEQPYRMRVLVRKGGIVSAYPLGVEGCDVP